MKPFFQTYTVTHGDAVWRSIQAAKAARAAAVRREVKRMIQPMWMDGDRAQLIIAVPNRPGLSGDVLRVTLEEATLLAKPTGGELLRFSYQPLPDPDNPEAPPGPRRYVRLVLEELSPPRPTPPPTRSRDRHCCGGQYFCRKCGEMYCEHGGCDCHEEPPGAFCACSNPDCPTPEGTYTHG